MELPTFVHDEVVLQHKRILNQTPIADELQIVGMSAICAGHADGPMPP